MRKDERERGSGMYEAQSEKTKGKFHVKDTSFYW